VAGGERGLVEDEHENFRQETIWAQYLREQSRLLGFSFVLLPSGRQVVTADVHVLAAVRALLHRPALGHRERCAFAAFLTDRFDRRPGGIRGVPPQFGRAAFELDEDRTGPFDVGPLDPNLRLVDLGDQPADPDPDLGDVLRDVRFYSRHGQGVADELGLHVVRSVIDRNRVTKCHVADLR
jgi:hypothetical protein